MEKIEIYKLTDRTSTDELLRILNEDTLMIKYNNELYIGSKARTIVYDLIKENRFKELDKFFSSIIGGDYRRLIKEWLENDKRDSYY